MYIKFDIDCQKLSHKPFKKSEKCSRELSQGECQVAKS